MPDTMRAAYVERLGGPEQIRVGELPVPRPGPTDVLVQVAASAVNVVDGFVRAGYYQTPLSFPFVLGRDLVGMVVEPAPGFEAGERVWCNSLGHGGRQGAAAEYAVVPTDRLYRLPPAVDDPRLAVASLHPAATAWLALHRHAHLVAGETVYVGGAAGSVGSGLVQLAAESGARVIACARDYDTDWCTERGAVAVLDYRDPALYDAVRELAPDGVNVWIETSGHNDFTSAVPLLARGGRVVVLAGYASHPVADLPVGPLYTRDCSLLGFSISNATAADLAAAAPAVSRLIAGDRPVVRIAAVLPLSAAARAHRIISGEEPMPGRGRLVLVPDALLDED